MRINFGIALPNGEGKWHPSKNDHVDVDTKLDDEDYFRKCESAIREKYPVGKIMGWAPHDPLEETEGK